MPNIYLRNKGGVGNQLFMYAFAKSLALQTGASLYIDNASGFAKDPYQRYPNLFRVVRIQEKNAGRLLQAFFKCCRLLPQPMLKALRLGFITEPHVNEYVVVDKATVARQNLTFIEGYFQSYQYFAGQSATIFQQENLFPEIRLTEPYKQYQEAIQTCQAVSVHVRRVQYANELPLSYYEEAFALFRNQVAGARFFVFSDDLEWCMQNFHGNDIHFIEAPKPDEIQELFLMTICKNHIIANSSFSWWGAWLGRNIEKLVVAPKSTQIGVTHAFYPVEWKVI